MANIITCIRIVCALALIFCPTFSVWFYVLYAVGGISDVLDGFAARFFGKETEFGARLDTVADAVFAVVVIVKTVRAVFVPTWLIIWTVCIATVKCVGVIIGFVRYKRFVSVHTVPNKICGIILFSAVLCIGIFPPKTAAVPITLTCVAATVAAAHEGYCIFTGKSV